MLRLPPRSSGGNVITVFSPIEDGKQAARHELYWARFPNAEARTQNMPGARRKVWRPPHKPCLAAGGGWVCASWYQGGDVPASLRCHHPAERLKPQFWHSTAGHAQINTECRAGATWTTRLGIGVAALAEASREKRRDDV